MPQVGSPRDAEGEARAKAALPIQLEKQGPLESLGHVSPTVLEASHQSKTYIFLGALLN